MSKIDAHKVCHFKSLDFRVAEESPLTPPLPKLNLSRESHQFRASGCRWAGCSFDFVNASICRVASHIMDHIHYFCQGRCHWDDCETSVDNIAEMQEHLLMTHGVPFLPPMCFLVNIRAVLGETLRRALEKSKSSLLR